MANRHTRYSRGSQTREQAVSRTGYPSTISIADFRKHVAILCRARLQGPQPYRKRTGRIQDSKQGSSSAETCRSTQASFGLSSTSTACSETTIDSKISFLRVSRKEHLALQSILPNGPDIVWPRRLVTASGLPDYTHCGCLLCISISKRPITKF